MRTNSSGEGERLFLSFAHTAYRAHPAYLLYPMDKKRLKGQQLQAPTRLWQSTAGSGKTRVITHRIAYLVHHQHVSPWHILAVTFTNKAAREMRDRLVRLIGGNDARVMTIGTFHAICSRVLRMEAAYLAPLGLNKSFVIQDMSDQTRLVKQALGELDLDEKQFRPAPMLSLISRAKNTILVHAHLAPPAPHPYPTTATNIY